MVTVLAIQRHSAELCPGYNEASRNSMVAWMNKTGELEAKHSVTKIGVWTVTSEHLSVLILEAPTYEAIQAYVREPEVMHLSSWSTMEFKVATALEY